MGQLVYSIERENHRKITHEQKTCLLPFSWKVSKIFIDECWNSEHAFDFEIIDILLSYHLLI